MGPGHSPSSSDSGVGSSTRNGDFRSGWELGVDKMDETPDYREQSLAPDSPKDSLVRINIRQRGPMPPRLAQVSRLAQIGVIWTTHDVHRETKLCDLFQSHHLKGGSHPHGELSLQQINRQLQQVDGTEKYWWAELGQERVMDLNWVFDDNEVWLSCLTDEPKT